tara:strand:+ start:1687 stop:1794 length:108 start_codon:yes stop_codon:yes gene_type:complete
MSSEIVKIDLITPDTERNMADYAITFTDALKVISF